MIFRGYPSLVLVTGAAGAVGTLLCQALVELGVRVVATDSRGQAGPRKHSDFSWIDANLESEKDRDRLVAAVRNTSRESLGIVHVASFVGDTTASGWIGELKNQSTETWRRAIEVGLTAPFAITRDLSDVLRQSPGSAIVNVSSIYSSLGPDWSLYEGTEMGNPAAYGVAKAGLEQLTRWLATSLSPNVRVNAVSPGGLKRNQPPDFASRYEAKTLLRRMGSEADVVNAILFLLSEKSAYVTGQVLVVDGGYSIT